MIRMPGCSAGENEKPKRNGLASARDACGDSGLKAAGSLNEEGGERISLHEKKRRLFLAQLATLTSRRLQQRVGEATNKRVGVKTAKTRSRGG